MAFKRSIFFLACFLFNLTSGIKGNTLDPESTKTTLTSAEDLDSLDLRVKYYYVHNVDSAEILLNHILENLYRNDLSDKAFYPNLALAEFYQKYKPNKELSLKFMTTAMQIFIGNSENLHLGSYAFVDIGNLFFNFGYYEQAIIFYRIAYDVGLKTDNINGASLSLQNIGISFQFMHKLDSAFYYLNKAGADNRDTLDISRALNMNHLASLYFESHKMDEAEKYGLESISILEKFKNEHPEVVLGYNKSYFREWQAVRSSTDRFLMQFYYKKQEFDKSQFYYRQGIQDSEISGHYGRKARLMSSYALMYKLFPDTDSLIRYAHTTMNFLTSFHELDNERIFADSLSAMFLKLKLPIESASFNSISKQLSDSISKHAAPAETVNKMLLIASAATEQIEKRLSSGEKHHKTVTWLYQLLSFFITVSSVLMIAAVVVRSRKKRKELAEKNLATAVSGKNHNSLAKSILLMDQIHQYFRDEKPYLDPKLKVETLAKRMNTSYKSVNNAIVNVGNTSFNTLVNQYRVETAKMYLEDPERMKYKIEAIAHDSGFGSKQSFYNTFEELTGIKPSDFRSNMMKTKNMNSNSAV